MGRFGEKNSRGKTEMVWTCTEERLWVYWEKDAEDRTAEGKREGQILGIRMR